MRLRVLPTLLAALALVLPARLRAQAQATTGVIRGVVTDSTGAPLAGATVSLLNLETNALRQLVTNARGIFDCPIAEWNIAMMVNLAAVGVLLSISAEARETEAEPTEAPAVKASTGTATVPSMARRT